MSASTETGESSATHVGAFVALITGAVAMGASPIFVRLVDVGPTTSAFWRVALALPVLWAWDRYEARTAPAGSDRKLFNLPIVLAGTFFAGDLFFWHLAILNTTVANATFFATTAPFWVLFGTWLMKSEHIGRSVVIGLALAMIGGGLLVGESMQVDPERLSGDLYGLITAIFFGCYFLSVRAARKTHGAARITFASTMITALILGVVALVHEQNFFPSSASGFATLFALALISHAAGQGLLAFSLGHLPATFSSLVIFLEAIAAALFGWIALGEAVSIIQAIGGAVILLGIWIARPQGESAEERA